jgi:hypothetical protein
MSRELPLKLDPRANRLVRERIRTALGIIATTAEKQAYELGVGGPATVRRWLDPARSLPSIPALVQIGQRSGCSLDWLLGWDVPESRASSANAGSDDATTTVLRSIVHVLSEWRSGSQTRTDAAAGWLDLQLSIIGALSEGRSQSKAMRAHHRAGWLERVASSIAGSIGETPREGLAAMALWITERHLLSLANAWRRALLALAARLELALNDERIRSEGPLLARRLRSHARYLRSLASQLDDCDAIAEIQAQIDDLEREGAIVNPFGSRDGCSPVPRVTLRSSGPLEHVLAPKTALIWHGSSDDFAWYIERSSDQSLKVKTKRQPRSAARRFIRVLKPVPIDFFVSGPPVPPEFLELDAPSRARKGR